MLQGLDMKLVGILDDENNSGKEIFGYKVIGPGAVRSLNPDAILITSTNHQNSYVKNLMKQRDWDSIKIFII
jgi:ABC-type Fe3+-hydroxamate transport system substrate-binding protein